MTLTQSNPLPGLYALDGDPTQHAWGGTNLAIGTRLYRSDTSRWYKKTGAGATAWVADATGL